MKQKRRHFLLHFTVIFVIFLISSSYAADEYIEVFSPQGHVKTIRQVRVKFSSQMAPFGSPALNDPFDIKKCAVTGKGRWADVKNWVYDFDKDLPGGAECEFTLKPDVKTLKGDVISGIKTFYFTTGGPSVLYTNPYNTAYIDEEQIFVLTLDTQADEASVIQNALCIAEDINEQIEVKIITDDLRAQILKTLSRDYGYQKDKPKILIQCKRILPNNKKVDIIWGAGIKSLSGVENTAPQNFKYTVRNQFRASFSCQRENPQSNCIPFLPMSITFTSSIPKERAEEIYIKDAAGTIYKPEKLSNDNDSEDGDSSADGYLSYVNVVGPFPEESDFDVFVPKDLKDDSGRSLVNADSFPLKVKTAAFPPLIKFASPFGIIEKADPILPVTVRNVEPEILSRIAEVSTNKTHLIDAIANMIDRLRQITGTFNGKIFKANEDKEILFWLKKVYKTGRSKSVFGSNNKSNNTTAQNNQTREFEIKRPNDAKSFEVIGIPLESPGFYVIEMESPKLGKSLMETEAPMYVAATALVTNLSAHLKWGRDSSLVWVTTLDKAKQVEGASVHIMDCTGKTLWQGSTKKDGIAYITDTLPSQQELPYCTTERDKDNYYDYKSALNYIDSGLFVVVRTRNDMTFVNSGWDEGISSWRFNIAATHYYKNDRGHTVFDRPLFRAGETVHMKHIIRKQTIEGFSNMPDKDLPNTILIQHTGMGQEYKIPLKWDKPYNTALTDWIIPKDAELGTYSVYFYNDNNQNATFKDSSYNDYAPTGTFRVEEFKIPTMKGIIQPPNKTLINQSQIDINLNVSYLSGGGAAELPVKIRSIFERRYVYFKDYEDYVFLNGEVKEGIQSGYADGYEDNWYDENNANNENGNAQTQQVNKLEQAQEYILGEGGEGAATIKNIPTPPYPQNVLVEMEYKDPNGQIMTVSRRIPLWNADIAIGIKPDSWASTKENLKFQVAALDLNGSPLPNIEVNVEALVNKTYSHRKRLIGGFYSYEHKSVTERLGNICSGKTDDKGILRCESKSKTSGNIIIPSRSTDTRAVAFLKGRRTWNLAVSPTS
ncbi:alpha-2-macroglobulin family protein [Candidatus Magnetoovum chiemensis]|nr:alpha-2-macroglobulin family protein [Candidatus Magnetoovum chiemensis]